MGLNEDNSKLSDLDIPGDHEENAFEYNIRGRFSISKDSGGKREWKLTRWVTGYVLGLKMAAMC